MSIFRLHIKRKYWENIEKTIKKGMKYENLK